MVGNAAGQRPIAAPGRAAAVPPRHVGEAPGRPRLAGARPASALALGAIGLLSGLAARLLLPAPAAVPHTRGAPPSP